MVADEFAAKFWLVADSIRKHRSDAALVRIVVPVYPGDKTEQRAKAEKTAAAFVATAYPVISSYLPR